jgi:translation initiation factor 2 subunit 3
LEAGDELEILPGYDVEEKNKKIWKPLKTTLVKIHAGKDEHDSIGPSGSLGLMTSLDPSIVSSDKLSGSLVGLPGKLPPMWEEFSLDMHLLDRVVGAKEDLEVAQVTQGEALMLSVNSAATVGVVTSTKKKLVACRLKLPVCAAVGSRVAVSRMIGNRFRLIGYGIITE